MPDTDIPEVELIREIVQSQLPYGYILESVDLTFGGLIEGQTPAFVALIKILEQPDADPGYGLAHEITNRIREKWSRDDLYIKIQSITPATREALKAAGFSE